MSAPDLQAAAPPEPMQAKPVLAEDNPGALRVAGIGASAGGLDAARKFLAALPDAPGLAFILVQHLDPTHESMMAGLLGGSTFMPVFQAEDGMKVAANHLYIIPPGVYLALRDGALHLSPPLARHGARLPFDFFLNTLAASCGPNAAAVILSGTGADGALGCQAVKAAGGMVYAQDPEEAGYDGMPRSAIATGAVDRVLPAAGIAGALRGTKPPAAGLDAGLGRIVALIRAKTAHDFTLYKPGTLARRIGRRMALAGIAPDQPERYRDMLDQDTEERARLTEDLLINVTQFFRDTKVFDILAASVVPQLVVAAGDQAIRIWVVGCSTGEETYSLAMLFLEQISAVDSPARLQMFASDVDPRAIARARDGAYPETIAADVSPPRLARFFVKEDHGYRISQNVRACIVFAVQDVLADPPFSKLDLISCRNLLIYMRPEAQRKIISIFNFALRGGAFLLLGSAETVAANDPRFAAVSKPARLYSKAAHIRQGDLQAIMSDADPARGLARPVPGRPAARAMDMAEICRKLLLDSFSPAAILINARLECLYSTGPTAPYLRVAPGYPSYDVLTMMHPALRARVKDAIAVALEGGTRIVVPGGRVTRDGAARSFNIDIQPVNAASEKLLLVCFIDQPSMKLTKAPGAPNKSVRAAALERELDETRGELAAVIHSLEISAQEQNAINEEALSVNEEFQSTNEELLTSKEELQSLNEELTALNVQLHETLERSRMTSDDLRNILYSTDVATLFLDARLNIRFFTPPTGALFTIIEADIGRKLTDFQALTSDPRFTDDAGAVLAGGPPVEREIEAQAGSWYNRRILPYRTHDDSVAGLVITFTDITERKKVAVDLLAAQRSSERADLAKSRFLAAASHDLRQPLQTLTLLSGMLDKSVSGVPARKLLARLDNTAGAMASMLNTLLDINQIDSGLLKPKPCDFPINFMLQRLGAEFAVLAEAKGLELRVVPCGLRVHTDPGLLEQMIRNLLSNALKYTASGRVLLGCRRRGAVLSIKVGDTGIGIPAAELEAIFDEFHQLDNPARERMRGLGLGLSIVQRLGLLLELQVQVRSVLGRGSVFAIEVPFAEGSFEAPPDRAPPAAVTAAPPDFAPVPEVSGGSVLIIEDDETIRDLLEMFLRGEGFVTAAAADGLAALRLVSAGLLDPDVILADYNLPGSLNGLEASARLRDMQQRMTPVIILSGDTSAATLQEIAAQDCVQLSKPMRLVALVALIRAAIAAAPPRAIAVPAAFLARPVVFIVDDDGEIRDSMAAALASLDWEIRTYASCEAFLVAYIPGTAGCLLVDEGLPGLSGLDLLRRLSETGVQLPAIMVTGQGDVAMAVAAMKAGALDFLEKPASTVALLRGVRRALDQGESAAMAMFQRDEAAAHMARLTARQLQIMTLVLAGQPNKNIAADLGISQRTVESHRASIMTKTGAKSLPALARMAMTAK